MTESSGALPTPATLPVTTYRNPACGTSRNALALRGRRRLRRSFGDPGGPAELFHWPAPVADLRFAALRLAQRSRRRCALIVTHNARHFQPAAGEFGIDVGSRHEQEHLSLKLPASVKKTAAELAARDGVSLEFITAAVAEKVGCLRTAGEFLHERAGTAKPKDMLKYPRRAPKVPPSAEDQL